jgi:S1-C subfamily serine protease
MRRLSVAVTWALLFLALAPASNRPGWFGLGFSYHPPAGKNAGWMQVLTVTPNGPADLAGLKIRDVLVSIDGKPLEEREETQILTRLSLCKPGQKVTLGILRGDRHLNLILIPAPMSDLQWQRWQANFEMARRPAPRPQP